MKVSQLIDEICLEAESKFGMTDHENDAISVGIYSSGADWQIGLQRPTDRQLASGEVPEENLHTVEQYEYRTGFHTCAPTLIEALKVLRDRVSDAFDWEQ